MKKKTGGTLLSGIYILRIGRDRALEIVFDNMFIIENRQYLRIDLSPEGLDLLYDARETLMGLDLSEKEPKTPGE